jgi:hypothetical protein
MGNLVAWANAEYRLAVVLSVARAFRVFAIFAREQNSDQNDRLFTHRETHVNPQTFRALQTCFTLQIA